MYEAFQTAGTSAAAVWDVSPKNDITDDTVLCSFVYWFTHGWVWSG